MYKCIPFSLHKLDGFGLDIAKDYIYFGKLGRQYNFTCTNVDSFYSVDEPRDVNRNV